MSRLGDCLPEKHQGTLIIIFDIYDGKHLRYNVELELWLQMRRPRAPRAQSRPGPTIRPHPKLMAIDYVQK